MSEDSRPNSYEQAIQVITLYAEKVEKSLKAKQVTKMLFDIISS